MTVRANPTRRGEPVHVVLDSQGLAEVAAPRPRRGALVALEAAAATGGHLVVPTSVLVEQRFDPADARSANANRRLRTGQRDTLSSARATAAARLLTRAATGPSVVDAHVAAAALATVGHHAGTAVILTSDPADLTALVAAEPDGDLRACTSVHAL